MSKSTIQTSKYALFIDYENLPVSFLLQIISALEPFNVCFKKAYETGRFLRFGLALALLR
nr:hypothetical protein [uncultured Campylobacter sp.]